MGRIIVITGISTRRTRVAGAQQYVLESKAETRCDGDNAFAMEVY